MKKTIISLILCLSFLFSFTVVGCTGISARAAEDSVSDVSGLIDGILQSEMKRAGSKDLQSWLNGPLAQGAGRTSDWTVFSIRQYNNQLNSSSYAAYAAALKNYVKTNEGFSAATQQRYALLFIAVGQNRDYVIETANSTIGELGIMSWIYGLHLLNNGYTSTKFSTNSVVEKLLSIQISGGGWALSGTNADVDITAMTIQALAPHYNNSKVKTAVNTAVALLSKRQMSDGDFQSSGMGGAVSNAESTAQVITALSCLGINGLTDKRFIKNNNTLLDGLLKYRLADKSFCHTVAQGERSGAATVQALYSLISVWRMSKGYGSLYVISSPGMTPPQQTTKPVEKTTAPSKPVVGSSANRASNPAGSTDGTSTSAALVTDQAGEIVQSTVETAQGETSPTETLQNETSQGEISQQTETQEDDASAGTRSGAYKKWVCLAIVLLALGVGLVLVLTGKGNKKNLLAVLLTAAVLIGVVLMTGPKATTTKPTTLPQATGSVTIVIQCNEALEHIEANDVKGYENIVPQDGVMLSRDDMQIQDDETVLEVLKKATKDENIILIAQDGYVSNIGGLVERAKDFGPESGWLYSVNGEFPSLGASQYKLKDGDKIEFKYVTKRTDF